MSNIRLQFQSVLLRHENYSLLYFLQSSQLDSLTFICDANAFPITVDNLTEPVMFDWLPIIPIIPPLAPPPPVILTPPPICALAFCMLAKTNVPPSKLAANIKVPVVLKIIDLILAIALNHLLDLSKITNSKLDLWWEV